MREVLLNGGRKRVQPSQMLLRSAFSVEVGVVLAYVPRVAAASSKDLIAKTGNYVYINLPCKG